MTRKNRYLLEGMKVGEWAPLDITYDPPESQFTIRVHSKGYSDERTFRKELFTSKGGETVMLWRRVDLSARLDSECTI